MTARPVDRAAGGPLWTQVQDDLLRRVHAGEFDAAFPGEHALVDQYDVSRHTVRQALARLRADGVVLAERGRPPRLAPDRGSAGGIAQPVETVYSLFESVERTGRSQRSSVRALRRTADGVIAARLGLEESTPLLHVERLRYADDEPLAWDRVWLPYDRAAPLAGADLTHTALYRELAARTSLRIDGGQESIHAATANPAEAALLGVEPGAPVFDIERVGCCAEEPVEWRRTLVRGDRFVLAARFAPGVAPRIDADAEVAGTPA